MSLVVALDRPALDFSVGALPAVLLALFFTHSRGGILTLIVGAGTLIVLLRDRLWYLATLLIAAIFTMPAVLAVHSRPGTRQQLQLSAHRRPGAPRRRRHPAARDRGARCSASGACAGSSRGDSGGVRRALAISRDRRVLGGIGDRLPWSPVAIAARPLYGSTAWHKFTSTDLGNNSPGIAEASSRGRTQFWEVALEGFSEKPLTGHGAGTYQFTWDQLRPIPNCRTRRRTRSTCRRWMSSGSSALCWRWDGAGPALIGFTPGAPRAAASESSTRCF